MHVCVSVSVSLHCVGSQSPRVSAAEPEPLESSLRLPDGSSTVLSPGPATRSPPKMDKKKK